MTKEKTPGVLGSLRVGQGSRVTRDQAKPMNRVCQFGDRLGVESSPPSAWATGGTSPGG